MSKKKRFYFLLIKVTVSFGLIAWIIKGLDWSTLFSAFSSVNPIFFSCAVVSVLGMHAMNCLRWKLCLFDNSRCFPYPYLLTSYWTSLFPGLVLPSEYGGDALRIMDIHEKLKSKSVSFSSVFLSRFSGLAAIFTVFFFSGLFSMERIRQLEMSWMMFLIAGCAVLGVLFLIPSFRKWIPERYLQPFTKMTHLFQSRQKLFLIFSLAVLSAGMMVFNNFLYARALHQMVSIKDLALFIPLITIAGILPISIGGIGVKEGAFIFCFRNIGISPENALAIALLNRSVLLCLAVTGGMLFPFRKTLLEKFGREVSEC